jgi:DNA-binding transcriptional LysR family regulator
MWPAMEDLNDLYFFAKVVETGGFAAAARALSLPKSRLSRRVAVLEASLGVRLLQRTTRRLSLTESGKLYYEHARTVMAEADAAREAIDRVRKVPSGTLRVSCPLSVGQVYIAPLLPKFLAAFPQIRLDLLGINRRVDLVEEGIDVALRVRTSDDEEPNLVTRRFRPAATYVVVHPELLDVHGTVETPEDLPKLPALGFRSPDGKVRWRLAREGGQVHEAVLEPRLTTDDFNVMRAAALGGVGAAMLPAEFCAEDLRAGRLAHLLPAWSVSATLQAVYLSRRGMVPAVRVFLDFLGENLGTGEAVTKTDGEPGDGE